MRKLIKWNSIVMCLHVAPISSRLDYPISCCCACRKRNVANETQMIVPQTLGHYSIDRFIADRIRLKEISKGSWSHLLSVA